LQGDSVKIAMKGKAAFVNDAKLIATDLDASNGVIHVIDSVILPPAKKEAASTSPRQMIQVAIGEGAPLYNAGHAAACAKVYMTTAQNLLAMEGHGMCASTTKTLQSALTSAQHTTCSDTQAWTMRRALDTAYTSMASR
jgi:hypothetical protein